MSNLDQIQAAADALRTLSPKDRDRALSLATSDLPDSPGEYPVKLSYGPPTIARVDFASGQLPRVLQVTKCLALPDVEGPWQVNRPLFARWGPRIAEWDPDAADLSKTELVYHPRGNAALHSPDYGAGYAAFLREDPPPPNPSADWQAGFDASKHHAAAIEEKPAHLAKRSRS